MKLFSEPRADDNGRLVFVISPWMLKLFSREEIVQMVGPDVDCHEQQRLLPLGVDNG